MIDVLICSVGWRAPACLSLLACLRTQTLRPRRIVIRADSWTDADADAARQLGADIVNVEPGCGQQVRWFDVEAWPDPEAIVLVLDDDMQPLSTALEGYASVIGDDKKKQCAPAGISTGPRDTIQLAWGNALALYPAALAGLGMSDLSFQLQQGNSDEVVVGAWLRRSDCVIHRHPYGNVWPQHPLAADRRSFSSRSANLQRKLAQIDVLAAADFRPDAAKLWTSVRATVRHQLGLVDRS